MKTYDNVYDFTLAHDAKLVIDAMEACFEELQELLENHSTDDPVWFERQAELIAEKHKVVFRV